jgi:L-iditol 2-dehydrogenase
MQVAVYYGKDDIRLEEMSVPTAGAGEVLVRVRASGICGSDVMHWYRTGRGPLVLGHEIAGDVAAVGEGVGQYKAGDRITASHHVPCNTCHYCLHGHQTVCDTLRRTNFDPGGFAEYIRLPAINVERGIYLLPETLSYEEATFVEPLACVFRGQRIAGVTMGQSLLILGSGISGLLHVRLAKALGVAMVAVSDINQYRLQAAVRCGADATFYANDDLPRAFREANKGRAADIVVLTTGADEAIQQAFRAVDRGGTVLVFAPSPPGTVVTLPYNELFWRNEITVTSSYAANYGEHVAALELIRQRKVNVRDLITHRLPLRDIGRGFRLVEAARESLKVVIEP